MWGGAVAYLTFGPANQMRKVLGSDHREAPTVDGLPEGDITDVYSFVDPVNSAMVDFILNVNPFASPAESASYAFSPDLLYQIKIDNTGDYVEDQVIQIKFDQPGQTQTASVYTVRTNYDGCAEHATRRCPGDNGEVRRYSDAGGAA